MEFTDVVKNRYSCKKFSNKFVEKNVIEKILEQGRLSPTAKNTQEQRIYVLQSQEKLAKIDELTPCRYGAPTVLVVAFDKTKTYLYPGEKRNSGIEDASIVATHLCLAATNFGVDNCWINNFNPDKLHSLLNLPENEEILMLLDLGYASEDFKPLPNHSSRKSLSETVIWC